MEETSAIPITGSNCSTLACSHRPGLRGIQGSIAKNAVVVDASAASIMAADPSIEFRIKMVIISPRLKP